MGSSSGIADLRNLRKFGVLREQNLWQSALAICGDDVLLRSRFIFYTHA